jgi:hypothetical protein
MKNRSIASLFLVSALLVTGCKNYLEEDTTGLLYGPNVLSTQDGLESAPNGLTDLSTRRPMPLCWVLMM